MDPHSPRFTQSPLVPYGDGECAPRDPKPSKVLKVVGNVREVLQRLLLRESLALVVLGTQLLSISGPMTNNLSRVRSLYKR